MNTANPINWETKLGNPILEDFVLQIKKRSGEFYTFYLEVSEKLRDPIQYTHEKVR